MLNVVLYEPEIPPNTGNLIRLCANSGATLHLIEPLGFSMEAKALRRAGLDYHEAARVRRWPTLEPCLTALGVVASAAEEEESRDRWREEPPDPLPDSHRNADGPRVWAATSGGDIRHTVPRYRTGDLLLFGPESRGLPASVLADARVTARIRVPMRPGSRSLNLSNAVSIVLYEAWRQLDFAGAAE